MVDKIMEAIGGIAPEYVEDCGIALGYLPRKQHRIKLRSLLIAAAITALLVATVVASGIYSRKNRLAEMPAGSLGEHREVLIPNGFKGTPTYLGSSEWWAYMAHWDDINKEGPLNFDLSFTEGDIDSYLICKQYQIYEEDQLQKLYEIAETYNLNLYEESLVFSDNHGIGVGRKLFSELSGVKSYLEGEQDQLVTGNVFADGSFWLDGILKHEGQEVIYTLRRIYSGSIFPYGGAVSQQDYEEIEYMNCRKQLVTLDQFENLGEINYVDPLGEIYISFSVYFPEKNAQLSNFEMLQKIADRIDFEALLVSSEKPGEFLDIDTGAEDNQDALKKVEGFQNSKVYQASKEFQQFYTENFYGSCYEEPYGLPGFSDVDAEMDRLSIKYDLKIPKRKWQGNDFSDIADVYDNGSFCYQSPPGAYGVELKIHYIPKDALYTRIYLFSDIEKYRRVWEYETPSGISLIVYTEGTEFVSGTFALYENEDTYILLELMGGDPQYITAQIDNICWDKLLNKEE